MTREIARLIAERCAPQKPHLRFDKVAVRFLSAMQAGLHDAVPSESTLAFTVTAPIRLATSTAALLEKKIREALASSKPDLRCTINENRIRMRLLHGRSRRIPQVLGFVHNPDCEGHIVLDAAQSLLSE